MVIRTVGLGTEDPLRLEELALLGHAQASLAGESGDEQLARIVAKGDMPTEVQAALARALVGERDEELRRAASVRADHARTAEAAAIGEIAEYLGRTFTPRELERLSEAVGFNPRDLVPSVVEGLSFSYLLTMRAREHGRLASLLDEVARERQLPEGLRVRGDASLRPSCAFRLAPRERDVLARAVGGSFPDLDVLRAVIRDVLPRDLPGSEPAAALVDRANDEGWVALLIAVAYSAAQDRSALRRMAQHAGVTALRSDDDRRLRDTALFDLGAFGPRLETLEAHVCLLSDGKTTLTGFLVDPDLVLTDGTAAVAFRDEPKAVLAQFDVRSTADGVKVALSKPVSLHTEWLVDAAANLGHALLRLCKRVGDRPIVPGGPARGWVRRFAWASKKESKGLACIFARSAGVRVSLGLDILDAVDPKGVRHRLSLEPTSAGAPLADAALESVVALQSAQRGAGFPIVPIVERLREKGWLGESLIANAVSLDPNIFDGTSFPAESPEGKELTRLLTQAYPDTDAIRKLLAATPELATQVKGALPVDEVWRLVLGAASHTGTLWQVIDRFRTDPSREAYRRTLQSLLKRGDRPQVVESEPEAGFALPPDWVRRTAAAAKASDLPEGGDWAAFGRKAHIEELVQVYVEPDCQTNNQADLGDDPYWPARQSISSRLMGFLARRITNEGAANQQFILADAGMGKSSLLLMLRIAHHFKIWGSRLQCHLLKLGPDSEERLGELVKSESADRTVLLLDSLDEDATAWKDVSARLRSLLDITRRVYRTIVTCRTQFLPPEARIEQEAQLVLEPVHCPAFYLSLFTDKQVAEYLAKRPGASDVSPARMTAMQQWIKRMDSLRCRPLLLSYIDKFVQSERAFANEFEVYDALVSAWLDRESGRPGAELSVDELREVSTRLAVKLQESGQQVCSPGQLEELLQRVHKERMGNRQTPKPRAKRIESLRLEGKSLLNRTSNGDFRFSHYTVQEFLVAKAILGGAPQRFSPTTRKIKDFVVQGLRASASAAKSLRGVDLSTMDLSNLDLSSHDLSGANLSQANLEVAFLARARLVGANLKEARLTLAGLEDADLQGASLVSAKLDGVRVSAGTNLVSADLSGTAFPAHLLTGRVCTGMRLAGARLEGAELANAVLTSCDLRGAKLARANLDGANLENCILEDADLREARLDGANLTGATLWNAQLAGASLVRAKIESADLEGADLTGATLTEALAAGARLNGATLVQATLTSANLTDALLIGTRLNEADLANASLQRAKLDKAVLCGANLNGADLSFSSLSGADLSQANLRDAKLLDVEAQNVLLDTANLEGADLSGGDFSCAVLRGAVLVGTCCDRTNLHGASLLDARIERNVVRRD